MDPIDPMDGGSEGHNQTSTKLVCVTTFGRDLKIRNLWSQWRFSPRETRGALSISTMSLASIYRKHVCARPRTSAHPCWLMPTGPSTQPFPPFPSHPRPRIHRCPPGLLPIHFHPIPCMHPHRPHKSMQLSSHAARLEPKHRRCFWENEHIKLQTICYYLILLAYLFVFSCK